MANDIIVAVYIVHVFTGGHLAIRRAIICLVMCRRLVTEKL